MRVSSLKLSAQTEVYATSRAQTKKVYATKKWFAAHGSRLLVFSVISYQCLGLTSAQAPDRPPPDTPPAKVDTSKTDIPSPTVYVASFEDYKIGPGDVIDIKIAYASELSGTYAVSATGAIEMPFLGVINIKDKTPPQLSKLIGD